MKKIFFIIFMLNSISYGVENIDSLIPDGYHRKIFYNNFPDSITTRHFITKSIIQIYVDLDHPEYCENTFLLERITISNDSFNFYFISSIFYPQFEGTDVIGYLDCGSTPTTLCNPCVEYLVYKSLKSDKLQIEYDNYLKMIKYYKDDEQNRINRIKKYSNNTLKIYLPKDSVEHFLGIIFNKCISPSRFHFKYYLFTRISDSSRCEYNGKEYFFTCSRFPILVDMNEISK